MLMLAGCSDGDLKAIDPDEDNRASDSARAPAPDDAEPTPGPTASAAAVTRDWLVGHWAPKGEYCASDAPIALEDSGEYWAYEAGGNWSLDGARVTIVSRIESEGEEASGPEERSVLPVARTGDNEMRLGKLLYRRCPKGGGAEPWHPGEHFGTS